MRSLPQRAPLTPLERFNAWSGWTALGLAGGLFTAALATLIISRQFNVGPADSDMAPSGAEILSAGPEAAFPPGRRGPKAPRFRPPVPPAEEHRVLIARHA